MKVVILQHRLLHYRTCFFSRLRLACLKHGIELSLMHGGASPRERVKNDEGHLAWAVQVRNYFWKIGQRDLVWQHLPREAREAELVVIMQESRIISNYPLLVGRLWSKRKIAYWGHGKNFQSDAPTGLREVWKNFLIKRVDWWFAYTSMTVEILRRSGYGEDRITQLDNAIDTDGFKAELSACLADDLTQEKTKLGIAAGAPVGVFCGSLYPDKRLDLLVEAADLVRAQLPDFHLIMIGDGPSMPEMVAAASQRPWMHLTGVRKGKEKALYFRLGDVMLNPGLVGLHIVDAFCAGLVMITTKGARHSPEVAYLENGRNGLMTGDTAQVYAQAVLGLFADPKRLAAMKAAALADSERYTLDNMVENFTNGIAAALKSP